MHRRLAGARQAPVGHDLFGAERRVDDAGDAGGVVVPFDPQQHLVQLSLRRAGHAGPYPLRRGADRVAGQSIVGASDEGATWRIWNVGLDPRALQRVAVGDDIVTTSLKQHRMAG